MIKFIDILREAQEKADLVTDNVQTFLNDLKSLANTGLKQEKTGEISYKKEVETLQIALSLLGYELPKHGIDGLFGNETANAVNEFKADNKILKEDAEVLRDVIDDLGYTEKGNELTSGGGNITNELTKVSTELFKEIKRQLPNVSVKVTSGNDAYHKKITSYKSLHTTGQALDFTINPSSSDVRSKIVSILNQFKQKYSKFSFLDEYARPTKMATGGHFHIQYADKKVSGKTSSSNNTVQAEATPEMMQKLYQIISSYDITEDDLKPYLNRTSKVTTDVDNKFYKELLEKLNAPVTDENLKFLYAWRQAEGKAGNYNPFNTTLNLPNAVSVNSHKVKSYASYEDGMKATVNTISLSKYRCILEGLRKNIGAMNIARCESLKTWGTGDLVIKVLLGYEKGNSVKIKPLI